MAKKRFCVPGGKAISLSDMYALGLVASTIREGKQLERENQIKEIKQRMCSSCERLANRVLKG